MPSYTKNIIEKQSINQYILSLYPTANVKVTLEGDKVKEIIVNGVSQTDFDGLISKLKTIYINNF